MDGMGLQPLKFEFACAGTEDPLPEHAGGAPEVRGGQPPRHQAPGLRDGEEGGVLRQGRWRRGCHLLPVHPRIQLQIFFGPSLVGNLDQKFLGPKWQSAVLTVRYPRQRDTAGAAVGLHAPSTNLLTPVYKMQGFTPAMLPAPCLHEDMLGRAHECPFKSG